MIDLHTHLLPDWDDGAKDWDEMFKMAEVAHQDGIEKIVLTPHVYRLSKHEDDMAVFEERMRQFKERTGRIPIVFFRGAEVFVHHEMIERIREHDLTINGSDYVFVEFPANHVLPGVRDLFYKMMLEGMIPVISHPERNEVFIEKPELLFELVQMGGLAQLTGLSLTGWFGSETEKAGKLFLTHNLVQVIASDAHNAERRPPKLSRAVEKAAKIVGAEKAEAMVTEIPQAILDNREIPDYGEPENPGMKRRWGVKVKVK